MHVVVIGAGATGLAAAYLLARGGHSVTLCEASSQAGGLLATFDIGEGQRLEHFYHHFFTHDAEIGWLLRELGLGDQIYFRRGTMGVYRGGVIYPFDGPQDLLLKFRAIDMLSRFRFAASSAMLMYLPWFADDEGQTAIEWFQRWAGRAATDAIWAPMLKIKFGAAADRIPLAWMAGRLRQRARSRKQGEEKLGYLRGSLQVLVDRLVEELQRLGVTIRLNEPIRELIHEAGAVRGVQAASGPIPADRVVVTVPTPILSRLVRPLDAAYASQLDQIQYLGAICTILSLREPLSYIYWLNVADPGYDFGGVIEQTNLVGPENYGGRHLVYLSRYLDDSEHLWSLPDDQLLARQLEQLSRLYGRDVKPLVQEHWIFRGRYAAPLTEMGFHQRIPAFRSPLANLYVACMPHVYPDERSVNNSLRVAAALVEEMGLGGGEVPRGASLAAKYGRSSPDASPGRGRPG